LSREFMLEKGWYQAKLVVRDSQRPRVGAVTHEFQVPRLDGMRVSTPVLSDRLQAADPAAPAPARARSPAGLSRPGLRSTASSTSTARRRAMHRLPQVSAGYALVSAGGKTLCER
jgi:hypothetical protein